MMRFAPIVLIAGLALAALFPVPGFAEEDYEQARRLVAEGVIRPLEEVIGKALAVHPGRLLEAGLEDKKGRYIYEVEVVDDAGVVWEFRFDATNGKLLGTWEEE